MKDEEIQKLVDNAYLQGMHEAFVRISQAHADSISKLDKKVFAGKTLTNDEVAQIRNSSVVMAKLVNLENKMTLDIKQRISERNVENGKGGKHRYDVPDV